MAKNKNNHTKRAIARARIRKQRLAAGSHKLEVLCYDGHWITRYMGSEVEMLGEWGSLCFKEALRPASQRNHYRIRPVGCVDESNRPLTTTELLEKLHCA